MNAALVVEHPLASAVIATLIAFGIAAVAVLGPDIRWRRRQRRRGARFIYGGGR